MAQEVTAVPTENHHTPQDEERHENQFLGILEEEPPSNSQGRQGLASERHQEDGLGMVSEGGTLTMDLFLLCHSISVSVAEAIKEKGSGDKESRPGAPEASV